GIGKGVGLHYNDLKQVRIHRQELIRQESQKSDENRSQLRKSGQKRSAWQSGSALSQGERVDRDGAFFRCRGPGEGLVAGRGRLRQGRPKLLNGNE
ncbi:MAG: hypothetical protein ABSE93_13325, partial [Terriglobia bacterium]